MPRIDCFGFMLLAASLAAPAQIAPATRPQPGATIDPGVTDPTSTPMSPPAYVPGQPAPTTTAPRGPVRISGGVMTRYLRTRVDPIYPPDARSAHLSGSVVMAALIGKTGAVQDLTVVSGPPVLAASAVEAVRQWLYKPLLLDGQPTEVRTTITVNFNLEPAPPPPSR